MKAGPTRAPAGVWFLPTRKGRPKPYGLQWRTEIIAEDGTVTRRRKTEFHRTREKRDARATELRGLLRAQLPTSLAPAEIAEYRAFKEAIGNTPWQDIVAIYRDYIRQNGLTGTSVTIEAAVENFLRAAEAMVKRQELSPDSFRQKRHKLQLFVEQFGDRTIAAVSADEVETWITDFDEVRTEATFNNYRKHLRAFFNSLVDAGQLARNPLQTLRKRDDSVDEVRILTVEQTQRLFGFALGDERFHVAIGRLALEAFLGLRFSSGCRLEKSDINLADRGVTLPKRKIKTRQRHYLDGKAIPAQVWQWLEVTPEACWQLTPRQYLRLKSDLFTAAEVPHPHNCLRHSFATYDVAAHKNPGRTAYLLCHTAPTSDSSTSTTTASPNKPMASATKLSRRNP